MKRVILKIKRQIRYTRHATFVKDDQDGIALGIRNFLVDKLPLICFDSDKDDANELSNKIQSILGIPITIV